MAQSLIQKFATAMAAVAFAVEHAADLAAIWVEPNDREVPVSDPALIERMRGEPAVVGWGAQPAREYTPTQVAIARRLFENRLSGTRESDAEMARALDCSIRYLAKFRGEIAGALDGIFAARGVPDADELDVDWDDEYDD